MPLTFDANGCTTIRNELICKNNITLVFYDGHIRNTSDCTLDTCSLVVSNWGYLPNIPGNAIFIALFALVFALNIPLGIWKKTWGPLVGMLLGSALEAVGYGARIWANKQPFMFNPFMFYIIFLTIAPAFLSAAIYLCLTRIIVVFGQDNARFKPRTYSIVFMLSDLVALILQGAGGGIASVNVGKDQKKSKMGINIMIAGLVWQVVSLTIFAVAAMDLMWCVKKCRGKANPRFAFLRQSTKFKLFLWSLGVQTLVIYIRSVYRVAELAEGFTGKIADLEIPYMIFEPVMIIIACICMTVLHPSLVFGDAWKAADFRSSDNQKDEEVKFKTYTPKSDNSLDRRREMKPQVYVHVSEDYNAQYPVNPARHAPRPHDTYDQRGHRVDYHTEYRPAPVPKASAPLMSHQAAPRGHEYYPTYR